MGGVVFVLIGLLTLGPLRPIGAAAQDSVPALAGEASPVERVTPEQFHQVLSYQIRLLRSVPGPGLAYLERVSRTPISDVARKAAPQVAAMILTHLVKLPARSSLDEISLSASASEGFIQRLGTENIGALDELMRNQPAAFRADKSPVSEAESRAVQERFDRFFDQSVQYSGNTVSAEGVDERSTKKPLRVLISWASTGGGHQTAALAVKEAIPYIDPNALADDINILDFASRRMRHFYKNGYLWVVNRVPPLWGWLYEATGKPPTGLRKPADSARLLFDRWNFRKLKDHFMQGGWDVLVNVQYMPAPLIGALRERGLLQAPQMTITTDFDTHRLWIAPHTEHYTVATERGAVHLSRLGVSREDISEIGIPIRLFFSQLPSHHDAIKALGLPEDDRPVILQLAGAFGVGPIEEYYREILATKTPLRLIVVGGNEDVKRRLDRIVVPGRHTVQIYGRLDPSAMATANAAADLVISKSGGLTTKEFLAAREKRKEEKDVLGESLPLPRMIVISPAPGQESENSDFVLKYGAGVRADNSSQLRYELDDMLKKQQPQPSAQEPRLGRPEAAYLAAYKALELAVLHKP